VHLLLRAPQARPLSWRGGRGQQHHVAFAPLPTARSAQVGSEVFLDGQQFTELRMGRRVLVVDDDALVLETTAEMLDDLGCEVVTALSGEDPLSSSSGIKASRS
jgi:hypothetical protein